MMDASSTISEHSDARRLGDEFLNMREQNLQIQGMREKSLPGSVIVNSCGEAAAG